MVYMVLDESKTNYFCKVGLSRQIDARKSSYKSHSPSVKFLCACAGTEREEAFAHHFLALNGKRMPGREWFIVSEDFYNQCNEKGLAVIPKFANKKITWYY